MVTRDESHKQSELGGILVLDQDGGRRDKNNSVVAEGSEGRVWILISGLLVKTNASDRRSVMGVRKE